MTDEEFAKQFPTMKWLLPHREPSSPKHSWSELPGNIGPSAVNAATGLYEMARHPIRTLRALETAAGGAMNLMGADELNAYLADHGLAARRNPEDVAREEEAAVAVGQALKDRYWGLDNIKKTMITDPVGSALDILGIVGGGYGLVREGLSLGSKAKLAKIPGPALDAERLVANEPGPAVAKNNIDWTAGSKSNTIRKIPSSAGPSKEIQAVRNAQDMPANALNASNKPQVAFEAGKESLGQTTSIPKSEATRQTFLTKGLEDKRHNYPPDQVIADDVGAPQRPFSSDDIWDTHNAPPKFREIFNPPHTPQRPFDADYPKTPAHDENGKLLEDIDGDPIIAPYVAGRQTLGGNDVGFSPKQFLEIAKKLVRVETVPRVDIDDASGKLFTDPDTAEPVVIRIADDLNETRRARAIAHELGHAIHAKTGFRPIIDPVIRNELERNYSILASGPDSKALTSPSDIHGNYRNPVKSDRELVADAIYASLRKPNYGKTELPVFYKTLREWIKSNPDLARLLISNSIAAATVAAALGAAGESNETNAAETSSPHALQGNGLKNPGSHPPHSVLWDWQVRQRMQALMA